MNKKIIILFLLLTTSLGFSKTNINEGSFNDLESSLKNLQESISIKADKVSATWPEYEAAYSNLEELIIRSVNKFKRDLEEIREIALNQTSKYNGQLNSIKEAYKSNPNKSMRDLMKLQKKRYNSAMRQLEDELSIKYQSAISELISLNNEVIFATHIPELLKIRTKRFFQAVAYSLPSVTGFGTIGTILLFDNKGLESLGSYPVSNAGQYIDEYFERPIYFKAKLKSGTFFQSVTPFKNCNTSGCVYFLGSDISIWMKKITKLNKNIKLHRNLKLRKVKNIKWRKINKAFEYVVKYHAEQLPSAIINTEQ